MIDAVSAGLVGVVSGAVINQCFQLLMASKGHKRQLERDVIAITNARLESKRKEREIALCELLVHMMELGLDTNRFHDLVSRAPTDSPTRNSPEARELVEKMKKTVLAINAACARYGSLPSSVQAEEPWLMNVLMPFATTMGQQTVTLAQSGTLGFSASLAIRYLLAIERGEEPTDDFSAFFRSTIASDLVRAHESALANR